MTARDARDRLHRLEQFFATEEALERFFGEIIEHSINDRHRKGCFLVNSALEVAPQQHGAKSDQRTDGIECAIHAIKSRETGESEKCCG
jgi:hypothetical protein